MAKKFKRKVYRDGQVYEEEVELKHLQKTDHIPEAPAQKQAKKNDKDKKQSLYQKHGLEKKVTKAKDLKYKPKNNHLVVPSGYSTQLKSIPEFKIVLGRSSHNTSDMQKDLINRQVWSEFERGMELVGRNITSIGQIRSWHIWTWPRLKNTIEIFNSDAKLLEVHFSGTIDFKVKIAEIVTGKLDVEYWLKKYKEKVKNSKNDSTKKADLDSWLEKHQVHSKGNI